MTLAELLKKLDAIEKEKVKDIRDDMLINTIRLSLFPDGSGEVVADWSKYRKDMRREEALLHQIFSVEGPIFEFNNIKELETWLEDMTPEVTT